jgi:hypothetical protein
MITLCGRPSSRPARRPAHQTALRPALGGPQSRHSSHRSQSPHRTQALVVIMRLVSLERHQSHDHEAPDAHDHEAPDAHDCEAPDAHDCEARDRRGPADTQRPLLSRGSSR